MRRNIAISGAVSLAVGFALSHYTSVATAAGPKARTARGASAPPKVEEPPPSAKDALQSRVDDALSSNMLCACIGGQYRAEVGVLHSSASANAKNVTVTCSIPRFVPGGRTNGGYGCGNFVLLNRAERAKPGA